MEILYDYGLLQLKLQQTFGEGMLITLQNFTKKVRQTETVTFLTCIQF